MNCTTVTTHDCADETWRPSWWPGNDSGRYHRHLRSAVSAHSGLLFRVSQIKPPCNLTRLCALCAPNHCRNEDECEDTYNSKKNNIMEFLRWTKSRNTKIVIVVICNDTIIQGPLFAKGETPRNFKLATRSKHISYYNVFDLEYVALSGGILRKSLLVYINLSIYKWRIDRELQLTYGYLPQNTRQEYMPDEMQLDNCVVFVNKDILRYIKMYCRWKDCVFEFPPLSFVNSRPRQHPTLIEIWQKWINHWSNQFMHLMNELGFKIHEDRD